jgi:DnaJ-class molecular chaperone
MQTTPIQTPDTCPDCYGDGHFRSEYAAYGGAESPSQSYERCATCDGSGETERQCECCEEPADAVLVQNDGSRLSVCATCCEAQKAKARAEVAEVERDAFARRLAMFRAPRAVGTKGAA